MTSYNIPTVNHGEYQAAESDTSRIINRLRALNVIQLQFVVSYKVSATSIERERVQQTTQSAGCMQVAVIKYILHMLESETEQRDSTNI